MGKKQPENLVMVLTGATSGIGRATALRFAREGGRLVLAARSLRDLQEVAALCQKRGGSVHVVQADVAREEEVRRLAEEAVRRFGRIDVWVNNAAVIAFGNFMAIPPEDFRRVIEVNLFGYIYGARQAIRQFRQQGYGTLINIASVAGVVGQPFAAPYSISKFGVRGLSNSLEQELKAEEHIKVCTILPSTVDTPIYEHGANYTGKKIQPPVAVTSAREVAKAIIRVSKNPEKRVYVGSSTTLMRLGRLVIPEFFDKLTYYMTIIREFEEDGVPRSAGNLYRPSPESASISGGWMKKKRKRKKILQTLVGSALLVGLSCYLRKKIT
ncbi:MAG: SDR family oxidoreductase [Hymenobacteraceae bacterium]|nr:SDR family oxidoreductase [Hymenobacteraceae bacterium]